MPSDLSQLDETKPDGAVIPVSQLDNYQRETRQFLKGWADVEHSLAGRHALPFGTTAERPVSPPPVGGTIFINTETGPEFFDGAVWQALIPPAPAGLVSPFAGPTAPAGWLICDGTAVSRVTFARLFGVVGTIYGVGDGVNTFNLPDLRARHPVGLATVPGFESFGALGLGGGAQTQTPTFVGDALAAHTHGVGAHRHETPMGRIGDTIEMAEAADATFPDSGVVHSLNPLNVGVNPPGNQQTKMTGPGVGNTDGASGGVPSGTVSAINVMNPYQVLNYIIKT